MVASIILKFNKLWGVKRGVMVICVLDLRYKIDLLDYFSPKIYEEESDYEIEKVKTLCKDLVREYEMNMKGKKLVSVSESKHKCRLKS